MPAWQGWRVALTGAPGRDRAPSVRRWGEHTPNVSRIPVEVPSRPPPGISRDLEAGHVNGGGGLPTSARKASTQGLGT